jgi:hypothetical protein
MLKKLFFLVVVGLLLGGAIHHGRVICERSNIFVSAEKTVIDTCRIRFVKR